MKARHKKKISLKNFYKEFLKHISNSFPHEYQFKRLTDMEIEVLTEFWILEGDLIEDDRFSTTAKRHIREKVFNFKSYAGLENYLTKLLSKGFLVIGEDGKKKINPSFDLPKDKIRENKSFTLIYEYEIES